MSMLSFNTPVTISANTSVTEYSERGASADFKGSEVYEPRINPSKKWIIFGQDNQFPNFLIERARSGTIHYSLLLTKQNMVKGEGFEFIASELIKSDALIQKENQRAIEFFKSIELDEKKHAQICWEVVLFGGSYPQLVMGKNEYAKTSIKKIVIPKFKTVRLGTPIISNNEEVINTHFYHFSWGRNVTTNKPVPIMAFEKELYQKGKENLSYMITDYNPMMDYYPRPDYLTNTGLKAIMLEEKLMDFDISELDNGMSASGIFYITREDYSDIDPEKEKLIREQEEKIIKEKLQGSKNNGRVIIQRLDASDPNAQNKGIKYEPIQTNNNAERHNIITQRKDIAILAAHGIPMPDLAGVPNLTNGGFSSQAEMLRTALQILYHNRILPMQQIIEDFYNKLLELNDINVRVKIKNNLPLINYVSDNMWTYAFTKDEYRQSVGYSPLTSEQKTELVNSKTITNKKNTKNGNNNI